MDKEEQYRVLAKKGNLRYVQDTHPGITRKKVGRGFRYTNPDNTKVSDQLDMQRIKKLAIPPAYTNVWICCLENGHLQATGRDIKNRKQYWYHQDWEKVRDQEKFYVLDSFGENLSYLRQRIYQDMTEKPVDSRDAVMAAMLYILDEAHIRVGSVQYAQEHKTYGLTTLRKKHVGIDGSHVELRFAGKNKVPWQVDLKNRKLSKIVRKCEEIAGYELFKYIDKSGEKHIIRSEDINNYIEEITKQRFTAKVFRTWAACTQLYGSLRNIKPEVTIRQRQMQYNQAVRDVAKNLGHTVVVCKKSYITPKIKTAWSKEKLKPKNKATDPLGNLTQDERLFLGWWRQGIKAETKV